MVESPPFGLNPLKYHFALDGNVFLLEQTENIDAEMPIGSYNDDLTTVRIVLTGEWRRELIGTFEGDALILRDGDNLNWALQRMTGDEALSRPLEPRSIAQIATGDPEKDGTWHVAYPIESGQSLESNEPLVQGVWELIGYDNFPPFDLPPFGLPNEKWVFDENGQCTVLGPGDTQRSAGRQFSYRVKARQFVYDRHGDPKRHAVIGYNAWRHLTLNEDGVTASFKRISNNPSVIPAIPLKVIILRLRGQTD